MKDLINILHEGGHSLVVANGDIRTFDGRGVSDLTGCWRKIPDSCMELRLRTRW